MFDALKKWPKNIESQMVVKFMVIYGIESILKITNIQQIEPGDYGHYESTPQRPQLHNYNNWPETPTLKSSTASPILGSRDTPDLGCLMQ